MSKILTWRRDIRIPQVYECISKFIPAHRQYDDVAIGSDYYACLKVGCDNYCKLFVYKDEDLFMLVEKHHSNYRVLSSDDNLILAYLTWG